MRNLDLLIAKFNELKADLNKNSQDNDTQKDSSMAKTDSEQTLEKGIGVRNRLTAADAASQAHAAEVKAAPTKPLLGKPVMPKPHKATLPSPEEHAARANMYADFMPKSEMDKNVNGSYAADPNMAMSEGEELCMSANGQWNLKKSTFKKLQSKLEHEGKSKESAGAIAATIGREKMGKEAFQAKAAEAQKSEDKKCSKCGMPPETCKC